MLTYEEKLALADKIRKNYVSKPVPQEQLEILAKMEVNTLVIPTRHGDVKTFLIQNPEYQTDKLLINIHGGGFCKGHEVNDNAFSASISKQTGVMVLDVDYSIAPEAQWPIAYQECYDVIKWAFENQDILGINVNKLFIAGHSAGGNLAINIAFDANKTGEFTIDELFLDYPPLDLYTHADKKKYPELSHVNAETVAAYNALYVSDEKDLKNPYCSPYFAEDEFYEKFPTTTFLLAEKDMLCHEAKELASRLIDLGHLVTIKVFKGSKHGFTVSYHDDNWKVAQKIIVDRINIY